jgi:glycosyltransferase involved in cell wall biosynthesis
MPQCQIVGVVLVRNEDLRIRQVVGNIAGFCDRIFLADNGSTDRTPEILQALAAGHPQLSYHRLSHPRRSHDLIAGFADTHTWVFGVDGDELYDPAGLAVMRRRIFAGEFDDWWMVIGNVLNCDEVDPVRKTASGFLAPPCRSITKLYNFGIIHSWTGDTPERLHGGHIAFHPGHAASARLNLHETIPWADSPLRCLHTCFVARSSTDAATPLVRENIMDVHAGGILRKIRRGWKMLRGVPLESDWKKSRYRRGERVTIDATPFFP